MMRRKVAYVDIRSHCYHKKIKYTIYIIAELDVPLYIRLGFTIVVILVIATIMFLTAV